MAETVKQCMSPEHEGPNPLPISEFSKDRSGRNGLRSQCRACQHRKNERWRHENLERDRERRRNWRQSSRESLRTASRRRYREIRDAVFDHYGRACACCSSTENLTIDHVHGDGKAHREQELTGRETRSRQLYLWLIRHEFPPGYQVLCHRCNCSKGDSEACRLDHAGAGAITITINAPGDGYASWIARQDGAILAAGATRDELDEALAWLCPGEDELPDMAVAS